jgi:hypothetical protein
MQKATMARQPRHASAAGAPRSPPGRLRFCRDGPPSVGAATRSGGRPGPVHGDSSEGENEHHQGEAEGQQAANLGEHAPGM